MDGEGFIVFTPLHDLETERNSMNAGPLKNLQILLLTFIVLLNFFCQNKDNTGSLSAADLYGKWECYKISTLWKSDPDSVVNSPVDSLNNLYRITADSIINYSKTDSIPCYTKIPLAVSYSTNPADSQALDSNLIIQAEQDAEGIVLKYDYAKTDSIRECFLRRIDAPSIINVCDFGNTLFKSNTSDGNKEKTVPVAIQSMELTLPNSCSWF
jgi:hypothetical protein